VTIVIPADGNFENYCLDSEVTSLLPGRLLEPAACLPVP
jgi:hypothetical protein